MGQTFQYKLKLQDPRKHSQLTPLILINSQISRVQNSKTSKMFKQVIVFAALALVLVMAAPPAPAEAPKDLNAAQQLLYGYGYPSVYSAGYSAYPYSYGYSAYPAYGGYRTVIG